MILWRMDRAEGAGTFTRAYKINKHLMDSGDVMHLQ